ncbi:hypothetical protein L596_025012 [Steinernema carpocapsae]|uniref:MYND-type domain-containing protein n=1 Tax=Steinernema carpocapsae TaxID=34508 RepID=A0A4U5M6I8_STECR|nr:hypothetical protein L596_025012 [Steinernema carpocapsae]
MLPCACCVTAGFPNPRSSCLRLKCSSNLALNPRCHDTARVSFPNGFFAESFSENLGFELTIISVCAFRMAEPSYIREEKAKDIFELIKKNTPESTAKVKEIYNLDTHLLEECDENGMTALDQACFKGNEDLVDFLLSKGASADNKRHNQGYTCLMFAAMSGSATLCRKLLDAGARAHATNNINKTAGEIAAFIGKHECVSVISNHINIDEVEKFVHPKGKESDEIFPKEFVSFIHRLVGTHEIHPVKLVFNMVEADYMLKYRKKFEYVVDRMFEKQLRNKESNEVMSMKLWIMLHMIREMFKFVDEKLEQNSDAPLDTIFKSYARALLKMEPNDEVRPREERLLRAAVASFPYKHSVLAQTLGKQIAKSTFGKLPSTFMCINQALFGQRLVATVNFCATCGSPSATMRCSVCKFPYCSQECRKFDWPIHKACCAKIATNRENEENVQPTTDAFTTLTIGGEEKKVEEAEKEPEKEKEEIK